MGILVDPSHPGPAVLFEPLRLRSGVELPNRLAVAPLTNLQSRPDGTLGEPEYRWLERRARGGWGWISTCAAFVNGSGKAWVGQLGIASDAHIPGLRRLATAFREQGVPAVVQLHHAGSKATVAEDPISTGGPKGARAATEADLEQTIADYVSAALRAEEAGFSGVEIHGANGYLFTQFLAPAVNPRTDRWGGSLENRARLLRSVAQAIRAAVRPDFAVGARISPVDVVSRRGLVLADSVQVGQWLADDGLDFVHLSTGDAVGTPEHEPDAPPITQAFREALPADVAVFASGQVWTRAEARAARELGGDVVVLGKAAIGNPSWPQRVADDPEHEPVRPPWSRDTLREQDVGEAFIDYLGRFGGLVSD